MSTSKNLPENTDGWDIYRSDQVVLENSVINNGDDCVSFKPSERRLSICILLYTSSRTRGQIPRMFWFLISVVTGHSAFAPYLHNNIVTDRKLQWDIRRVCCLHYLMHLHRLSELPCRSLGEFAGVFDIVENVTATYVLSKSV